MINSKKTSKKVATKASEILTDPRTSSDSKSSAGSALSQTKNSKKITSSKIATKASNVLKKLDTSKKSKSVAGSTLSQATKK